MKGGAHPSAFAVLSFPYSKKVTNYCWVDRVFQSSDRDSKTRERSHDLPATFCSKTERLQSVFERLRKISMYNIYCDNINTLGYERKQNAYIVLLFYI